MDNRLDSHSLLWLTTFVMTAGGLAILAVGKRRTPSEELHTVCHGIVPLIAACAYFAMATGQGSIVIPADPAVAAEPARIFYFARYIDWAFTTPLLLVTVSLTAMHAGPKRAGALLGIVLADLLMIVTAFAFGASIVPWIKWTWFLISCVAFLGVYYVLWVSLLQASAGERADIRTSYRRNAAILSVLWLIYPLVLAIAPDGLGLISDAASVLCIAVLDVASKVVYGLMTVASDAKATDRDLAAAGPRAASAPRAAAA